MTELPFERAFRRWVEARGMGWHRLAYPRPEAGGDTTAYRLTPAAPPRGVVLAVHGAGNDALFALVGLAKRLLLRGLEVFAFDLDGHGRGGTSRLAPDGVASAVPAAVRACGAAARGLPLHTVGVSLGGSILLHALPELSPRPATATLICAPLQVRFSPRALARELGPGLLRTLWREREHYGLAGLIPSFGPWKRETYPLRLGLAPGPGPFGYVDALNQLLRSLDLEERAARVDSPTLLVYGAEDRLVPLGQGEKLARIVPHSHFLALPRETHLTVPLAPQAVERVVGWIGE